MSRLNGKVAVKDNNVSFDPSSSPGTDDKTRRHIMIEARRRERLRGRDIADASPVVSVSGRLV
jgi:hypothetical protein